MHNGERKLPHGAGIFIGLVVGGAFWGLVLWLFL